jgi:two-component system, NarL family, sensor histidine kinase UhpB
MDKRLATLPRDSELGDAPKFVAFDAVASSTQADHSPADPSRPAEGVDQSELDRLKMRVRELAGALIVASEAARIQLARELHDSVGPELTAARFALASMQCTVSSSEASPNGAAMALTQQALDAASQAARRIVAELHGPRLDGGIVHALSQWTFAFAERTRLRASLVCAADVRLTQLPHDAALAVFRVAQEALANVARHAGAVCADVRIESDAHHLILVVADDGCGISRRPRKKRDAPTTGFGLDGMRARCEAFDGSLRIRARRASSKLETGQAAAAQASGTTVRARFAWDALLGLPSTARTATRNVARDTVSAR